MTTSIAMPPPGGAALDMLRAQAKVRANIQADSKAPAAGNFSESSKAKARAASVEFESVFLNSMFQQMFTGLEGEGPFGGNGATGVWRSFLTDEYSKSFAKAGGIGIADQVYASLLKQQEIQQ